MNPIFSATVKKGKVIFDKLEMLNGYLISFEGKQIDVVIRKKKKIRSNVQNAWYWSCVVSIPAEHFGYTPDEMHEAYKFLFLKKSEEGKPLTVRSTTQLSTAEFTSYIEQCRQWCAGEGLVIPDPGEVDFSDDNIVREPTSKQVKEHQKQVVKEVAEEKSRPVEAKTLDEIYNWVGKHPVTKELIMQMSQDNFGKEPRFLTQEQAERLDTLIVSKII